MTSPPTGAESAIVKQFEPLSADQMEHIGGFIARGVVDIARYRRSSIEHPDKQQHYARLERCTRTALRVRFAEYVTTQPVDVIEGAAGVLADIEWPQTPNVVIPSIRYTGDQPDPEEPYALVMTEQKPYVPKCALPIGWDAEMVERYETAAWLRMRNVEAGV